MRRGAELAFETYSAASVLIPGGGGTVYVKYFEGRLFVDVQDFVGTGPSADEWTWPNGHPAGPDQTKIRAYPDDVVAFAAKIFSNNPECRLKSDGEVITVGQRLTPVEKTYVVAMINHVHGTAYTTGHILKLRSAVGRRKKQPAATEG